MALKTLKIPFGEMKGLMQAVDDNLLSLSYSPDFQNFTVKDGILSTRVGSSKFEEVSVPAGYKVNKIIRYLPDDAITTDEITIVGAHGGTNNNRWYGCFGVTPEERAVGTKTWNEVTVGGVYTMRSWEPFKTSYILYEKEGKPVIVITTSSALEKPNYIKLDGFYNTNWSLLVTAILGDDVPAGAGFIALHRDRVWLSGRGTLTVKNTASHSNAYDFTDWSTAGEAGDIKISSPDNDIIMGMVNWLDDIVCLKKNSIWKIAGDIPSEYSVEKVYATKGTLHPLSLCSDGSYCFYAGDDGIYRYDGSQGIPVLTNEIRDVFKNMSKIVGAVKDNKVYMFNVNDGSASYTGKSLVYDMRKKTVEVLYLPVTAVGVFGEDILYANGDPAYVYKLDDAAKTDDGTAINAYWNTPETDLGYPHAEKTITDMYFNAWGTDNAGNAGGQVKITAYYKGMNGVQKTKEKIVTLSTTRKQHDVRLGITGRLFKFKFENVNGSAINLSGITLVCELAED